MLSGEGVQLQNRFDLILLQRIPKMSVVNIGVPGYGTDQQVLRAQQQLPYLRRGDIVLMLFYGNDLHDVARTPALWPVQAMV